MDKIDADFKVCFHGTIPQPDYSKPLASHLVGFTWEQSDNIPTTAKSCDKLQPREQKNEKKSLNCWVFSSRNQKEHCTAVKSILE